MQLSACHHIHQWYHFWSILHFAALYSFGMGIVMQIFHMVVRLFLLE